MKSPSLKAVTEVICLAPQFLVDDLSEAIVYYRDQLGVEPDFVCIPSANMFDNEYWHTIHCQAHLPKGYESAKGESRRERLTELVITFAIDSEKYVELKGKLSAVIFLGCDCFAIHDAD